MADIEVTIKPIDFRKASGYTYSQEKFCPLQNALIREGYNITNDVGYIAVGIDGKRFSIPYDDVWGGPQSKFSSKRIDRLVKLSKLYIPFIVPTVKLTLTERENTGRF